MADLYESNESEDVSSFLQILLHNSSSAAAASDNATTGVYYGGGETGTVVAESSSSMNFSDPGCFFAKESDGINSSSKESRAHVAPANPHPPRSSKRSRAAEVHNLSEKRRRSRINEKLKALQNLIPNSNKTDKASMLDDAIEYLKQLQLQVQMLTVRNGLSLHPGYSLGPLQSMLASSSGIELDEGNAFLNAHRAVTSSTSNHQNVYVQSTLETATNISNNLLTQPTSSLMPSIPDTGNSGTVVPIFAPSMQNHYGLLNHSKDICRDDKLSQMQLDLSCSGNNSSPGMSSS